MSFPTGLAREDNGSIRITWDDGSESVLTPSHLRRICPCATCREKKRDGESSPAKSMTLPVISAAEARPLRVEAMRPVGNYAYNIVFSDGHDSGIFPFKLLRDSS